MPDDNIKVVTLIQARMSSTRMPQKVMMSLVGKPLLYRIWERVMAAKYAGEVVVITSDTEDDDKIEQFCNSENIKCFRGHLTDLLDRHYKAGTLYNADAVVKIPSDCPLIDPAIIDKVIGNYLHNSNKYDYVSNLHPATYPDGNDVEIINFTALEKAWLYAKKDFEREHTTPYIWENPDYFRIGNVIWETGLDYSSTHRFTIDYEEDYIFISNIYNELYTRDSHFSLDDILKLIDEKPYLHKINVKYAGEYWYNKHINELHNIKEFKSKMGQQNNA
jgi:spore coat polysaccharide biosynthesis protein SpsF